MRGIYLSACGESIKEILATASRIQTLFSMVDRYYGGNLHEPPALKKGVGAKMSVHLMDSILFGDSISTPKMRAVFEEQAVLQRWLDVEAALACAQAHFKLIPQWAAQRITACAQVGLLELQTIKDQGKLTGHSLVGFLREFRRVVGNEAAGFIHFGATTQDIIDTAQMLGMKEALGLIEEQLITAMRSLLVLTDRHAHTVMAGRTHGGQALPITLGFKMAVWLDELNRQLERLREMKKRDLVGNMTGAVGTFASWGDIGYALQARVMELLGLGSPDACWHSSRDRVAEVLVLLGLIGSSGACIAREVYNLSKTEVAEVEEPFSEGQVGSSTMPHKRNPIHSEWIIVLSRILRYNAAIAMETMVQENERDASAWKTEWIIIPESFVMASSILGHLQSILVGLVVHPARMEENMGLMRGLLLSESVMFVLAETMPLPEAHETVYKASMRAFENGTSLLDELLSDPEVKRLCDKDKISAAMDARSYLGQAMETVRRVKDKVEAQLAKDETAVRGGDRTQPS
jgi:adenylosuccinate lyase